MPAISGFNIRERGPVPAADWRPGMKEAWGKTGRFWHRQMREKHFAEGAKIEYGYLRRSPRYEERKRKKFGHARPLEFTGESRALTRIRVVTSTSKGVKVRMNAARGLRRRNPKSQINMVDELTRISARERPVLVKRQSGSLGRAINRIRYSRTRKV